MSDDKELWAAAATALAGVLGYLGGRRGKNAAASKDESEAMRISAEAWKTLVVERRQLSEDLVKRLERLEAENKRYRTEHERALHEARVAREEAATSRLKIMHLEGLVADLIGRLRSADLITTGDIEALTNRTGDAREDADAEDAEAAADERDTEPEPRPS